MQDNTALDDNRLLLEDGDEIPLVASSAVPAVPVQASVSRPNVAAPSHAPVPAAAPRPAVSSISDTVSLLAETPAEEREITTMEQSIPARQPSDTASLDDAVNQAIAALGLAFADPDISRRFHVLVSMYFRDLRDRLETKSKFTMPLTSGGMGMADTDAEKAMATLAEKVAAYHVAPAARAVEQRSKYVTDQAEKHFTETEDRGSKEQHELERAHASLLAKAGIAGAQPQVTAPQPVTAPKMIPVVAVRPSVSVPVSTPSRPVLQALAAAAVAVAPRPTPVAPVMPPMEKAAPPPNLPVAPPEVEMTNAKRFIATPVAPAPAVVLPPPAPVMQPAPAPVAPPAPKPIASVTEAAGAMGVPLANAKPAPAPQPIAPVPAKPTMTDVQSAPRLTGPVEELHQVTLIDFRRLSKEPKEATLKIKDKIDLLDELGFETKTQGIKAFLESPINRLYLDVLRASLEGKPVPEVIAAMEARGTPTLSKPEFDSLMDLNRRLRFG